MIDKAAARRAAWQTEHDSHRGAGFFHHGCPLCDDYEAWQAARDRKFVDDYLAVHPEYGRSETAS